MALDGYVIAIGILSFLMSFSIGANDAANALATSYGSNALKLLYLVLIGSVFEFIGAFWCSGHVAGKLVANIIEGVNDIDDTVVEKMMLGASISSFLFIMSSSIFGMPISGTHTVVGALIGSGLATVGAATINWGKLGFIVASWFVAPVVSIIFAGVMYVAVYRLTLTKEVIQFKTRLLWLTLFTAIAFFLIALMFIKLIDVNKKGFNAGSYSMLAMSPVFGVLITRLVIFLLVKPAHGVTTGEAFGAILKFWTADNLAEMLD